MQPSTTSPLKRRYVADSQDAEIVKRIKQSEVELRDRNTVLRGIKPNVGCRIYRATDRRKLLTRTSRLCEQLLLKSSRDLKKQVNLGAFQHRLLSPQASD